MQTFQGFGIHVVDQEFVPSLQEFAAHRFAHVPDPDEAQDGLHTRTPSLSVADYCHGPDRRTCRTDELQGRADEVEATVPRGGEILQNQILDYVDAVAGQEDQMPRHHAPERGISEPNYVPRHVVRPDSQYLPVGEPVRGARSHTRSRQIAFFILPAAAVAGPDERNVAGLDVYALLLAAVLEILLRDGVAGLELIGALARGHIEEDSGGQYGGYLLYAESMEAARALDAGVHRDLAEERQGIRLVAERVDVGSCVLSTHDDAGGPGARPCFFGPVLVLVAAVQVVGVAGLSMGGVDGHAFRAGLLQVKDARTDHHTRAFTFSERKSSGRDRPPRTPGLRATGCAVGSGRRSGGGFGLPVAGLLCLLHIFREIYVPCLRSPRRSDDDQYGAYDQE